MINLILLSLALVGCNRLNEHKVFLYKEPNSSGKIADFIGSKPEYALFNCMTVAEMHEDKYGIALFCSEKELD